jgi:hypothetical protein
MDAAELVRIDLTDDERRLLVHGLNEYLGPAKGGPLLTPLVGLSTTAEFYQLLASLMAAIENGEPLSDLDWARALVLTEISWASDLLGAGIEFSTNMPDEKALRVLRELQRKISSGHRFELLRDNARIRRP